MRNRTLILIGLALGLVFVLDFVRRPSGLNGETTRLHNEKESGVFVQSRAQIPESKEPEQAVSFERCPSRRKKLEDSDAGTGNSVVVYRAAPGPMKDNHMAMLDKLDNGSLVLVWQFSSGIEGVTDQRLALSLSIDGAGETWTKPRVIPIKRNSEKGELVWFAHSCKRAKLLTSLLFRCGLIQVRCGVLFSTLEPEKASYCSCTRKALIA